MEVSHTLSNAGCQMLRDRWPLKGQCLLRKEGSPTYVFLSRKFSIVAIYSLFERLSQRIERKLSCFRRAFNESHPAFVELSTKATIDMVSLKFAVSIIDAKKIACFGNFFMFLFRQMLV